MSHESFDDEETPEPQNTYWLRRVLAVLAGLLVLSLLWWVGSSLFGGGDKSAPVVQATPQNSDPASVLATPTPSSSDSTLPTASATPSALETPSSSASPTVSSSALTSPTPSASATGTPSTSPSAAASTPAATGSVVCDPSRMSVKVQGSPSVTIGTPTTLEVRVTNGGANECYLDFAKTPMSFRITSGPDVILSSASCPTFAPSGVAPVPAGKAWSWRLAWGERRATGCTLGANTVAPGTYVATAKLADVVAGRQVMVLHH